MTGRRPSAAPYNAPVEADAVVLAVPGRPARRAGAARSSRAGIPVVSTSDAVDDVRGLLDLGPEAEARGIPVVVGAGFSPGLTCVLARPGGRRLRRRSTRSTSPASAPAARPAPASTTGPCGGAAIDWRDGGWVRRPAGSGRELCWFPDPVGAADCYRAALPDALLLVPAFPGIYRVTARLAATRRDRLTARLPMLRPPHPEGGVGAVRVEVRGRVEGSSRVGIYGAMDRPGVAGGAVAALAAVEAARGDLARPGAAGLAGLVDSSGFLIELARRGVKVAMFEGAG